MTIEDFDFLDGVEKGEAISDRAVFLAQRTEGCFVITLYQLDGFYVELYFHNTQFLYKSVRTFTDVGELSPYLDQMDISELFFCA
jgi:hypothetical protein